MEFLGPKNKNNRLVLCYLPIFFFKKEKNEHLNKLNDAKRPRAGFFVSNFDKTFYNLVLHLLFSSRVQCSMVVQTNFFVMYYCFYLI